MAREKKPVHKVVMTEGKRNIIQQLLQEYDIQDALKDLLGGTIRNLGQVYGELSIMYEGRLPE